MSGGTGCLTAGNPAGCILLGNFKNGHTSFGMPVHYSHVHTAKRPSYFLKPPAPGVSPDNNCDTSIHPCRSAPYFPIALATSTQKGIRTKKSRSEQKRVRERERLRRDPSNGRAQKHHPSNRPPNRTERLPKMNPTGPNERTARQSPLFPEFRGRAANSNPPRLLKLVKRSARGNLGNWHQTGEWSLRNGIH